VERAESLLLKLPRCGSLGVNQATGLGIIRPGPADPAGLL
jgi:hypothetical protein